MNRANASHRYSWPQIFLHWISALIIVWVLLSGFYVAHIRVEPATFHLVSFINVALSLLLLPIFVVRWLVRLCSQSPVSFSDDPWARWAAKLLHEALYWTIGVVLLSGVLMLDRSIDFFGWWVLDPLLNDRSWQARWFSVHFFSCLLLAAQLTLHIGAVVWHELNGRRVLQRMAP